ncbi:hypothetical protein, partial [Streptomyces sp. NPDC058394]|uniref:hypothetical protein n=1 Tax=Streptomyces sp. NPDC058394 TaxID=3346477 RepID=UPI00364D8080
MVDVVVLHLGSARRIHYEHHSGKLPKLPCSTGSELNISLLGNVVLVVLKILKQIVGVGSADEDSEVSELVAELSRRAVLDVGPIEPDGLGPELFLPRPTAQVLAVHQYDNPVEVFEFFRRIDLLSGNTTPSTQSLNPSTWDTFRLEATHGRGVVRPSVQHPLTGWAPDPTLPALPPSSKEGIPKISFSIWKGGVPRSEGRSSLFWHRLSESADRHRDLQHVLVADINRAEVHAAMERSQPPADDERATDVWKLVRHLQKHQIRLADSQELYGPGREMINARAADVRARRRTGTGIVVGSDILRLNLLYDYGGMYRDGNKLLPSTDVFQKVADSVPRFGHHHASGNGAFIAPRRHPQIRAFLDEVAESYGKDQVALER